MKCASELREIRQKATEEYEKGRIKTLAELLKNSIEFCETVISPALEKEALSAEKDVIKICIKLAHEKDSYNNEVLYTLHQGTIYANGSLSYTYDNKIAYSKIYVEKYLQEHCLSVDWVKTSYKKYGFGTCNAVYLIVEAKLN